MKVEDLEVFGQELAAGSDTVLVAPASIHHPSSGLQAQLGTRIGAGTPDMSAMLSHTPPTASSYEAAHMKRPRNGSISGRLRSASDLEERGIIDAQEKATLKDLIIRGEERIHTALDRFEQGDSSELESLMHNGTLSKRGNMDLMEELDLTFSQATSFGSDGKKIDGSIGTTGNIEVDVLQQVIAGQGARAFDDLDFTDIPFGDGFTDEGGSSAGSVNCLAGLGGTPPSPSMLGRTPPDPFTGSFEETAVIRSGVQWIKEEEDAQGRSGAIAIPGTNKSRTQHLSDMVDSGMAAERRAHTGGVHANHTHAVKPDGPHDGVGGDHKNYIGAYSPEARKKRIQRFLEKRKKRVWTKKVKYDVRKNFADSRMRVKGRFVKKEDEELLRDLMSIT